MLELLCMIFGVAALCPWLHRRFGHLTAPALAAGSGVLALGFLTALPQVGAGELFWRRPWVAQLGLSLNFRLDGLSLLFALMITGIGAAVFAYSGTYLKGKPRLGRFYLYLTAFLGSMLGLVLADNFLLLFVFWELTSLTSYFLIGYEERSERARAAALQALLTTAGGGIALLAGWLLLGKATGVWHFSELTRQTSATGPVQAALGLLLLGAFTKSAIFPFHYWLPNAMQAPTPVSSYLHSATMVKAGVYLIARLSPAFGEDPLWQGLVLAGGGVTAVLGAVLALFMTDAKRLLAYSTLSMLGLFVLLLGLATPGAVQAAITLLIAHALYKAALFQCAGTYTKVTGSRDLRRMPGLRAKAPLTVCATAVGALSLAAVYPSLAGLAKEWALEEALLPDRLSFLPVLLFLGAAFSALAVILGVFPLRSERAGVADQPGERPGLWAPPLILSAGALVAGLGIGPLGEHLLEPAVAAVLGRQPTAMNWKLWHGFTPALALELASVTAGVGLGWLWHRWLPWGKVFHPLSRYGPAAGYDFAFEGGMAFARWHTRLLQNGKLRIYVVCILATYVALVFPSVAHLPPPRELWDGLSDVRLNEALLAILMLVGTAVVVAARDRMVSIIALGIVGYGSALLFVTFSAPDLGMTQFLIETLSILLFVLVFRHVDPRRGKMGRGWAFPALFALVVGVTTSKLVSEAVRHEHPTAISRYYAEASVKEAHGHNVVNVILVDFRALDTLGEIVVLAIAAAGVFGFLGRLHRKETPL